MPYVNHNKVTAWTTEQVAYMLATDDRWLERAIVALHRRQTDLEQRVRETFNKNEIGLQVADARLFSAYAEKIQRLASEGREIGTCLSETEKREARRPWARPRIPIPTICKYRQQVLDMIEANAKAKMGR